MKRIVTIALIFWAIFVACAYFGFRALFDSTELEAYRDSGETVYGRVHEKDEENRQLVTYTYEVDGRTYQGFGNAGAGNPRFEEIKVGDRVVVFYDPQNPAKSILGYPQFEIELNRQMIIAGTSASAVIMLITLLFVVGVYGLISRRSGLRIYDS